MHFERERPTVHTSPSSIPIENNVCIYTTMTHLYYGKTIDCLIIKNIKSNVSGNWGEKIEQEP